MGGSGHLSEINERVKAKRKKPLPDSWEDMIRRVIYNHSSDSEYFKNKNPEHELFRKIGSTGNGNWTLRSIKPRVTANTHIKVSSADLEFPELPDISLEDENEFPEGAAVFALHKRKERHPQLIIEAKKYHKSKTGKLTCEVCNFDFEKNYGELGKDFIEAHHIKPISEMKEGEKKKVKDIVMLCSN